jgi:hypothetical protein
MVHMVVRKISTRLQPWLWLVLAATLLLGCRGRPARKKLPDLNGMETSFEGASSIRDRTPETIPGLPPFYATDTTVRIGGHTTELLAIALPDPDFDSLAQRMVKAWAPSAAFLRDQLLSQGCKGVLIDLRTEAGPSAPDARTESYRVEGQQAATVFLSIPVVFCWDAASAGRAMAFIDALRAVPGFRFTRIVGSETGRSSGAAPDDCFSAYPPTNFDQQ